MADIPMYHEGSRRLQDRFRTRALADRLAETLARQAFTDEDRAFIAAQRCFFLATADADGHPDCSYKGGDPGFVRVLDERTLAFPSYDGNGMYKSLGNVLRNPHVGLLFIDFESPRRLRVNGRATVSEAPRVACNRVAANKLAEFLTANDIPALAIHGNKSQSARTQALAKFKAGTLQVLVATDIAARGIDISELPHVVNFELPNVAEDYVHRIGRTGRAGAEGDAVSLVCVDEYKLLTAIEKLIKRELPSRVIAGFEPDPRIKAEPIKNGRGGEPRGAAPSRNPPRNQASKKPGIKKPAGAGFARPTISRSSAAIQRSGGRGR